MKWLVGAAAAVFIWAALLVSPASADGTYSIGGGFASFGDPGSGLGQHCVIPAWVYQARTPQGWRTGDPAWKYVYTGPAHTGSAAHPVFHPTGLTIASTTTFPYDSFWFWASDGGGVLNLYVGDQLVDSQTMDPATEYAKQWGTREACSRIISATVKVKRAATSRRGGKIVFTGESDTGLSLNGGRISLGLWNAKLHKSAKVRDKVVTGRRTVINIPRLNKGRWQYNLEYDDNGTHFVIYSKAGKIIVKR